MKLKIPLPPQYNTGHLIGQTYFLLSGGQSLMGSMSLVVSLGGWYAVYTMKWEFLASVPVWLFFLSVIILFILLCLFRYSIMVPSQIAFSNLQSYKHENPAMESLNRIEEELKEIKKLIKNE